jgi:hypothetical protein
MSQIPVPFTRTARSHCMSQELALGLSTIHGITSILFAWPLKEEFLRLKRLKD